KKLGIPIYTTKPQHLEDIPHSMKNLGCLMNLNARANQAATQYSARLHALYRRYHAQKKLSVFYQLGSYALMTVNKDSWINEVITLCGGANIFAEAKTITPEIGWEAVIAANPQVIITDATQADWKKRWQAWPQLTAIQHNFMFALNPDLIDRASPRLLE